MKLGNAKIGDIVYGVQPQDSTSSPKGKYRHSKFHKTRICHATKKQKAFGKLHAKKLTPDMGMLRLGTIIDIDNGYIHYTFPREVHMKVRRRPRIKDYPTSVPEGMRFGRACEVLWPNGVLSIEFERFLIKT